MRVNKETRQLSRAMLRASFVEGRLDKERISKLVDKVLKDRPRNYIQVLEQYRRLLRLEVAKRHARIESATELPPEIRGQIESRLKEKYGSDLTTEFAVNPELLGGMRIRVGSDVWDSSVRNRLQRLQEQL